MRIFFFYLFILLSIVSIQFSPQNAYAATCSGTCFDTANTPSGCSWNGAAQDGGCASQWHCYSCSACSDGCFSSQLRTGITRDSTGGCNIVGSIASCPGSSTGTCGGNSFVCTSGGWAIPTPTPTPTPLPSCSGSCYNTSTTPSGCEWGGATADLACAPKHCYVSCTTCSDGCYPTAAQGAQLRTNVTRDDNGACNIIGNIYECNSTTLNTIRSCGGTQYTCNGTDWVSSAGAGSAFSNSYTCNTTGTAWTCGSSASSTCSVSGATPTPTPIPPTATPTPTPIPTYSISGIIYVDINRNRQYDSGVDSPYTASVQRVRLMSGSTEINYVNTNTGFYSFTNVTADTYTVEYRGEASTNNGTLPAGYIMSYPLGTPPSFPVSVGPDSSNNNFGITNSISWFQGAYGDMRLDSGFKDEVPATTPQTYASLDGTGSQTHGILFSGNRAYNFCVNGTCPERASKNKWIVGGATNPQVYTPSTPGVISTSYDYFTTTAGQSGTSTDLATKCTLSNCTLPANFENGVYKASGDATLNAYTFPANKNYVFLVNGNLIIKGNIKVPIGSTVTFTVSGNIIIDRAVGETTVSSITSNIEGFYSADGSFIIEGAGPSGCPTPDRRLNVAGSIVINAKLSGGSLQNQRDLCSSNLQYPSLYIVERPDFILYAPEFIKQPNFIWKEVAP